jgi:4-hydroxy-4-methyl-2-oxoglutarate aldolase
MLRDELIEAANKLSSASLHEAAGKMGALPSTLKPLAPHQRLCGRALPVACPSGDNLFLHHAIYAAQPGVVLVADTAGGKEFGYWGEIMAEAARTRGLTGLVITGGVRDSARMIEMGFPVFSEQVCIRGTSKNPRGRGSIGQPVRIGEVIVALGDLVFGDADGVVVLPQATAAEAIAAAAERDRDEGKILQRIRAGETTLEIYKLPGIDPAQAPFEGSRRSVVVQGLAHSHLPIPVASRVGRMLATGGVRGVDPATGVVPATAEEQAVLMFANLKRILEAGGGRVSDILKVTIWSAAPESRAALNGPWIEMFPDEGSRPARHILNYALPAGMLMQCEALALLGA